MADNETAWILLYEYVEGIAEKRAPYREAHLQRIRSEQEAGHAFAAGAIGIPPVGGAFGFRDVDREHVEAFAQGDPYNQAGLIVKYTIEPWTLV